MDKPLNRRDMFGLGAATGMGAFAGPDATARVFDGMRKRLEDEMARIDMEEGLLEGISAVQKSLPDFIDDYLSGGLWSKQHEIVQSVAQHKRTVVRSGYGAGKSHVSAKVVVAFLNTFPSSIVVTTAPSDRQVTNVLWRYIRREYASANRPLLGKPLTKRIEVSEDWYALGFKGSDNNADAAQGFHAENILVVVDEAAGVSETLLRGLDSILTGVNSRLLMIGNPTSTSGMFRAAFHEEAHRYNQVSINAFDTPNFTTFGITYDDMVTGAWEDKVGGRPMPYPAMVDPVWVADTIDTYGAEHPYVESAVHGTFPDGATNVLLPLSLIEAAQVNEDWLDRKQPLYGGFDVGRYGDDESALVIRQGNHVIHREAWHGHDTMESAARVHAAMVKYEESYNTKFAEMRIDANGIGAGVYDNLKHMGLPVVEFNASLKSSDPRMYPNLRNEMWHQLRQRYEEGRIGYKATGKIDVETKKQLTDIRTAWNPRYTQVVIEGKDDAKKRGVKSPDRAEAEAMAFVTMPPVETAPPPVFGIGVARPR